MKDKSVFLGHILSAIGDIETYASAGRAAFDAERMRQDAIVRQFEIVGEAVKQLPESTRSRRPDVPWRQIAGMRDRLLHGYFGVDLNLVWATIERDLPGLKAAVIDLLANPESSPEPS